MHLSLNCCNCPRLQAFFTSANTNTHTQTHTYFYCRCSFLCFLADQIYVFALWSHVLLGDLVNPGRAGGRKQKSLWVGVGIWKGTDTHFTFMATQNHYNKALQTPNGKLAAGGQPPPPPRPAKFICICCWLLNSWAPKKFGTAPDKHTSVWMFMMIIVQTWGNKEKKESFKTATSKPVA